ncbi:TPA: hypothetical protein RG908_000559 [Klebsiella aerogenes]|jgi:hypothetical protein|uniref:hypothetical protein n=1 Tax=Klebsiella aerogenes TaxID=548 RepID=UPI00045055D3|nr:hypothetical protein [Klebsiella aerogenes]AMH08056.1 hypothetical protein AL511_02360 [Klebsiella aerogenes]AML35012.1 Hypothetical protein EAG7_01266 [Klebsiella aerogenes]ATY08131.1 hypothetical protein AM336_22315 [Klebsiella aerogenes]EKU8927125.1 hypothetical protein [Klebsiella aerogenes]EKU9946326.1 hypothetical protein [Klebsiella aerogenes]
MTDITELATVLRLAAESEIAYRAESDTSDLWQDEASPENILALVEALEKAQQRNTELENYAEAEAVGADKAAEDSVYWMNRCKEMESRTVTVKLPPKIERNDVDGWFMYNGGRVGGGAAEWYNKALDDVGSELTGAGIKWEAE